MRVVRVPKSERRPHTSVEVANVSGFSTPSGWAKQGKTVVRRALRLAGVTKAVISLVLVSDVVIRSLNHRYRGKRAATDVLSFGYEQDQHKLVGEIIICLAVARRQAARGGHSCTSELNALAVHGALHLAGYDHQTAEERRVMRQLEHATLIHRRVGG